MGGNQSKGDEVDQIQLDGHLQVKSYPRGKTVRQRELLNPYYAYTPYSTLQNPHYVAPPPYRPIGGRNDGNRTVSVCMISQRVLIMQTDNTDTIYNILTKLMFRMAMVMEPKTFQGLLRRGLLRVIRCQE